MTKPTIACFLSLLMAAALAGQPRDAAADLQNLTAQSRQAEPEASAAPQAEPGFSLEARPDDSPDLVSKKAALRLFKSFQVTLGLLNSCKAEAPEAGPAIGAYNSRNGSTVGQAMKIIRNSGGITPDIRKVIDAEVARAVSAGSPDCRALVKAVEKGDYDLYKAPALADDYRLIKSR